MMSAKKRRPGASESWISQTRWSKIHPSTYAAAGLPHPKLRNCEQDIKFGVATCAGPHALQPKIIPIICTSRDYQFMRTHGITLHMISSGGLKGEALVDAGDLNSDDCEVGDLEGEHLEGDDRGVEHNSPDLEGVCSKVITSTASVGSKHTCTEPFSTKRRERMNVEFSATVRGAVPVTAVQVTVA